MLTRIWIEREDADAYAAYGEDSGGDTYIYIADGEALDECIAACLPHARAHRLDEVAVQLVGFAD